LISDYLKDDDATTVIAGEIIEYSEYTRFDNINTRVKGQSIRTNDNSLEKRSLEMRINIQNRIF